MCYHPVIGHNRPQVIIEIIDKFDPLRFPVCNLLQLNTDPDTNALSHGNATCNNIVMIVVALL